MYIDFMFTNKDSYSTAHDSFTDNLHLQISETPGRMVRFMYSIEAKKANKNLHLANMPKVKVNT